MGEGGIVEEAKRDDVAGRGTRLGGTRSPAGNVDELVSRGRTECRTSLIAGGNPGAEVFEGDSAVETPLLTTTTEPSPVNRN